MERYFYAVKDNTVYSFPRKSERDKFCQMWKAQKIFAYDRARYRSSVSMRKCDDFIESDNSVKSTQSEANRAVFERLRAYSKHVNR